MITTEPLRASLPLCPMCGAKWISVGPGKWMCANDHDFSSHQIEQRILALSPRPEHRPPPLKAAAPMRERSVAPDSRLPTIECTDRQLRDVTRDAVDALMRSNDPPELFVQRGQIVRVRLDELGRPLIEAMTARSLGPLRGRLAFVVASARTHGGSGHFVHFGPGPSRFGALRGEYGSPGAVSFPRG